MRPTGILSHPEMPAVPALVAAALLFAFSSDANAQMRRTATGGATVTIAAALSARQSSPLNFGRIVPSTKAGQIAVSPDGKTQCTSNTLCSAGISVARFRISGADSVVTVTVPVVVLLIGPDDESMTLIPRVSTTEIVPRGGVAELSMGGTLSVAADQRPGDYSGHYEISLEYQ